MATINGITIKSYREFSGIEYPTIRECTVWKDGKKIGTYREDEWGASGHFTTGLEETLRPFALQYQRGCYDDDEYKKYESSPEIFLSHILYIAEMEKLYKKGLAKNHKYTLFIGNNDFYIAFSSSEMLITRYKRIESIQKAIKKNFPNDKYYLFEASSLDDFCITVDEYHRVPFYIHMRY